MKQTILSIAGKPGLYKLVSHAKMNLIVETIDEKKKRIPTFATDRVTSLSDISMFTEGDDVPLYEVLVKVREKEGGARGRRNNEVGEGSLLFYHATIASADDFLHGGIIIGTNNRLDVVFAIVFP